MINFKKILWLPKSLLNNIRIFGLKKGIIMPILFSSNIKIGKIYKGCVEITNPIHRFMIEFGVGGSLGIPSNKGYFSVENNAKVVFEENAYFAEGNVIRVDNGIIHFGANFNSNKNNIFWCNNDIFLETMFYWDILYIFVTVMGM